MASFHLPQLIEHSGWGPNPTIPSNLTQALDGLTEADKAAAASALGEEAPQSSPSGSPPVGGYQPVPAGAFQFSELPFQPFNKHDKLWRVSDWTSKHEQNDRWGNRPNWGHNAAGGGILGDDGIPVEDESAGAFSLVDNRPKLKPRYGKTTFKRGMMNGAGGASGFTRGGGGGGQRLGGGQRGGRSGPQRGGRIQSMRNGRGGRGGSRGGGRMGGFNERPNEVREYSVAVSEDWPLVMDIDMSNLGSFEANIPADSAEDIEFAGSIEQVATRFNAVNLKKSVNLVRFENKQHFTASTSEDPILQELMRKQEGNVYATDAILSALMASPRSVTSWDILVRKEGDNIVLDKRPLSKLDFVSVNENSLDSLNNALYQAGAAGDKDNINHPENLSVEATFINHNFSQQILTAPSTGTAPPPHNFEQPNPFVSSLAKGNDPASVAFRYRKWRLPGGVTLVARSSLNGFVEKKGEKAYVIARALNEFDSKLSGSVDWRQKLETQHGAVLASEMKNNQYKLARWIGESILAGADELRLGFVSRVNPKSNMKHTILMTKTLTPAAFATSVNVQTQRLWGTLSQILTVLKKQADGHYLLIRDPHKNVLHLHTVPANAFDHEIDDGEDEEFM